MHRLHAVVTGGARFAIAVDIRPFRAPVPVTGQVGGIEVVGVLLRRELVLVFALYDID